MADKVPVKATFDSAGDADGLSEFVSGDTLGYAHGGTGLSALGSAGQILKVNSGASALEWGSESALDIDGLTDGTSITIADTDKLAVSDGGSEKYVNASQVKTYVSGTTALTGGDLTIYEDANNADVSLKMGTSATESLTIEVLNGSSNKTAEEVHFSTATASGTADHGKMVFDIDGTDIMTIDDGGVNIGTGSLETASIDYTDGDLSMTIADGGKVTFSAGFSVGSDAAGDILYHNGTSYVRLAKGTAGQTLTMNAGATAPEWATASSGASLGLVIALS